MLLIDILKQFTGINGESPAKCLELFARNLTPGWTSWGNEVRKMLLTVVCGVLCTFGYRVFQVLKFQAVKSVSQENH